MMKLDSYQREALIQQVLDAHHFVPGKTVDRRLIRAMAADLRAAFERAGARWDEVAQFAVLFLENWRRHPRLSAEEISMTEKAFRDGFGLLN
jgi:hypothetical protein